MNKNAKRFIVFSGIIYFAAVFARLDYAAVMAEIIAEGVSKVAAGGIATAIFVTYGAGQLLSGWLCDRFDPRRIILIGLICSSVLNFLMPLCPSPALMTAVWGLNGLAQAMLWPPYVRFMRANLNDDGCKTCISVMNTGGSVGIIFSYLIASFLIAQSGWRSVFLCGGILSAAGAVAFLMFSRSFDASLSAAPAVKSQKRRFSLPAAFFFVAAAAVLIGFLRDGTAAWMPTLIAETFSTGTSGATLASVALPAVAIIFINLTMWINLKLVKSVTMCAFIFFVSGLLVCGVMYLFGTVHMMVFVVCGALIEGFSYGMNLMLICVYPTRFAYTGHLGIISGGLNSVVYIGSAVASLCFGIVSEHFGTTGVVLMLGAVLLVGSVLCLISYLKSHSSIKNG